MAVVDEEGKLFGVVNAVDLMIILIVIVIGFLVYYSVFGTEDWTYIQIRSNSQPLSVIENLQIGDAEYGNITGRKIGEIVNVEVMPTISTSSDIIVTMKVLAKKVFGDIVYKETNLKINSSIEIETERVLFTGLVIEISETEPEDYSKNTERKIIEIEFKNVGYRFSEAVEIGTVSTPGGLNIFITDFEVIPLDQQRNDLVIRANIPLENRSGRYFFGGSSAGLGSEIVFPIGSSFLRGNITEVSEPSEENSKIERKTTEMILVIDAGNISVEYLQTFSEGDDEKSYNGKTIAEIVGIRKEYASEFSRRVFLTVRAKLDVKAGYLFYKGNLIKNRSSITINTPNSVISGKIESINSSLSETKEYSRTKVYKKALVLANSIPPWLENKFAEGDSEINSETGELIVTILSKTTRAAEVIVTTDAGDVLKKSHPKNKDSELELELMVEEDLHGRLYFKGKLIRVNSRIMLEINSVAFGATIHEITDLNG